MSFKLKLAIAICIIALVLSGCDTGSGPGIVIQNPGFVCEGNPQENSTLCSGDDTNLTQNTLISMATSCTSEKKCEYVCSEGYKNIQSICVKSSTTVDTNNPVGNFVCSGSVPANAILCADDNSELTQATPITLTSTCTAQTKCETTCKEGYVKEGEACVVPLTSFSCTGTPPANSVLCKDDNRGLTVDTAVSLVSFCSTGKKCEYVCTSGNTKQGNTCVGSGAPTYSCTGDAPQNATLCSGDDTGLTWGTARTLVTECTSGTKCEYTCNSGYEKQSTTCVEVAAPPTPSTCTSITTINLVGSIVAVASPGDINSSVSPQGEKSAVFLIFDNNVLVDTASNPYATASGDVIANVTSWLKEKNVEKVVLADSSGEFSSALEEENMDCFKASGKIRTVIGWGLLTGKNPNDPY